jgi:hypothetical protein
MPRAYTIGTAALALDLPSKWLDNTLSHIRVAGVRQTKQGIARRISIEGLVILAVAALLIKQLELPLLAAINLAEKLASNEGLYTSPEGIGIRLDLERFKSHLLERLERAVEIAPIPRRGRPPKTKTGRLD